MFRDKLIFLSFIGHRTSIVADIPIRVFLPGMKISGRYPLQYKWNPLYYFREGFGADAWEETFSCPELGGISIYKFSFWKLLVVVLYIYILFFFYLLLKRLTHLSSLLSSCLPVPRPRPPRVSIENICFELIKAWTRVTANRSFILRSGALNVYWLKSKNP